MGLFLYQLEFSLIVFVIIKTGNTPLDIKSAFQVRNYVQVG
jgi:hypothetical protein